MKLYTYLIFDGNCGEAFRFYQQVLGGELQIMKMSDAPMEYAPEQKDLVMHASLESGEMMLMASDNLSPTRETPAGFQITLGVNTPEEAEQMFAALSDGGEVTMPMEKTFFAERYGAFRDRFGMPWQVMSE